MGEYSAHFGIIRKTDGTLRSAIFVNAKFSLEGDQWVAVCDELGTSTYAETIEQAREELSDAVLL